jgi:hypothetical protein
MADQFVGRTLALSNGGLSAAATQIGVALPEVWAVISVETSGCGFLPDRRPQILYERHLFHALTHGHFDDGDISDPEPGGYGAGGAHQYDRLARAMQLDRTAALKSTSWGLGQILGKNSMMVGFADVEAFVQAMSDSEDAHITALAAFVRAAGASGALRTHDWTSFARTYNGPAFAKNQYDVRLRGEFEKFSAGVLPDLDVRAAQLYLTLLGFHPGKVDGVLGRLTRSAIVEFQNSRGLPATGDVDDALLALIAPAAAVGVHP